MNILAITHHNGIRLAELGFLLAAVAGGLIFVGALTPRSRVANLLAGAALAVGAVLVIIAIRKGHFR
jgi:hypothetical protein